ncbi:hypothetical protein JJE66_33685 [Bradyrhizobium diazoefficiens]|uniref:hypothetical protein n=1 Tax=Bradyrhizobium diazoefficiens TaxID=1355477 RepID=UPI00190D21B5|nr:hypothetical protein [Bradyrhizobium diazoefficiens]MBK3666160.1 hypothetical protein [Bradyrhizobium diazoefficiens]
MNFTQQTNGKYTVQDFSATDLPKLVRMVRIIEEAKKTGAETAIAAAEDTAKLAEGLQDQKQDH